MRRARRLRVGELVLIGSRPHRVVRVGPGSATVEPADARHARFETADGKAVEFDAPTGRMTISPYSEVQRVDPAEVAVMAKKKTTEKQAKAANAPKAPKAPKHDGPLMTFAFRLPPDESKLIHKAAGPRGASNFARTVLVAAANGDLKAVQAAIDAAVEAVRSV